MPEFSVKRADDGSETEITGPTIAGRNPDCGLRLPEGGPEGGPSRKHAQLTVENGALWVEDLGSKNGTFVNDAKVTAKTRLKAGDKVRFDRVTFLVHAPPDDVGATVMRPAPAETQMRPAEAKPQPAPRPAAAAPKPATLAPKPAAAEAPARPAAAPPPRPQPAVTARPQAVAAPAPRRAEPAPAPAREVPLFAGGARESSAVPGAWADPEAGRGDGKTVLISPDRVKEMMSQPSRATGTSGDVDVPTLTCVAGPQAGRRFKLQKAPGSDGKTEWTLGSDTGQDIAIAGEGVSAQHASLINEGARWKIVDRLSSMGTFVNNKRTNTSFLASGDEVRLGVAAFVFELPGGHSPRMTFSAEPGTPRRKGRLDLVTLGVSFLVTAVIIFVVWRFFLT